MCHPERRRQGAKRVTAVVEPVGRCVASGSTMERMLFSPEILLGNASHCFAVRLRYASLRMTRAGRERGVIHCFLRDAEDVVPYGDGMNFSHTFRCERGVIHCFLRDAEDVVPYGDGINFSHTFRCERGVIHCFLRDAEDVVPYGDGVSFMHIDRRNHGLSIIFREGFCFYETHLRQNI